MQFTIEKDYRYIAARFVSQKILKEVLSRNIQGCIASIFNHSFNIETDERFLINIGAENLPMTPRSILLSIEDFHEEIFPEIYSGLPFSTLKGSLYFPGIGLFISVQKAAQFNPKKNLLKEILPKERVERNLSAGAEFIRRARKRIRGIDYSPLSDYFLCRNGFISSTQGKPEEITFTASKRRDLFYGSDPKLWKRIDSFLYAIRKHSWDEVTVALKLILGFGPGLTPSGDDFLSGFIAAGIAVNQVRESISDSIRRIIDKVREEADGKTTKVSISMIEDACNGDFAEPVWKFIRITLLSEEMSEIESACQRLWKIGGSSGEDLFNGLATGILFFICNGHNIKNSQ